MPGSKIHLRRIGHRTYTIVLAAVAASVLGAIAATNFIVDPVQRFREPLFYPPQYDTQQRVQAPALARSADYDSVILGTSTAENVFAVDANPILGGRFLRLPISGGSPREQRMVLNVTLGTGKPKRVLWLLDGFALTQPPDFLREDFGPFPHHMYANGIDGISRYLMNFETFEKSAGIIVNLLRGHLAPALDPDRLNAPADDTPYGRERVMAAYRDGALRSSWAQVIDRRMSRDPKVAADTIETNIVSAARANPNLRFDLVLVPPSIAQLAFWSVHFPDFFETVLGTRHALVHRVDGLGNVVLHDFWSDTSIVSDLDRYADMIHFDRQTTREILAGVAAGQYRTDTASIAASEAELRARIAAFRERNPAN